MWTKLNSLYQRILCAKFTWNWPDGSREVNICEQIWMVTWTDRQTIDNGCFAKLIWATQLRKYMLAASRQNVLRILETMSLVSFYNGHYKNIKHLTVGASEKLSTIQTTILSNQNSLHEDMVRLSANLQKKTHMIKSIWHLKRFMYNSRVHLKFKAKVINFSRNNTIVGRVSNRPTPS